MLVHQIEHLTLSSSGETVVHPPPPPIVKPEGRYVKSKCLAGNGETYTGNLSVSLGGHTCLPWSAAEVKALIKGKEFLPQVQLVKNHCRNPDGDMEGPWCYVKEAGGNITIDYCDLELCGEWTELPSTNTHTLTAKNIYFFLWTLDLDWKWHLDQSL